MGHEQIMPSFGSPSDTEPLAEPIGTPAGENTDLHTRWYNQLPGISPEAPALVDAYVRNRQALGSIGCEVALKEAASQLVEQRRALGALVPGDSRHIETHFIRGGSPDEMQQ